jgi:DNA primase
LLKRFSRKIILALDADAAGDKATLRGLQVARQALDREADPVFDARGLLGSEGRLKADIRVTTLPDGLDPDEVVASDPEEWDRIVSEARPIVVHVMETLAKERDLEDPKVKSEIAGQVLPLIEDVRDSVEREAYRQRLARFLKVDERAFLDAVAVGSGRRPTRRRSLRAIERSEDPRREEIPILATADLLEAHCLSVLLRQPDMVYLVDRALLENGLSRLSMDDFQSADHQILLQLIDESLKQDHSEPNIFVQNSLTLPLMELADQLLLQTEKLDPNENKVLEDLLRTLIVLRQRSLFQQIDHLRYLMEEAQESPETSIAEYQRTMVQYITARSRLDRALGLYTSHMIQ